MDKPEKKSNFVRNLLLGVGLSGFVLLGVFVVLKVYDSFDWKSFLFWSGIIVGSLFFVFGLVWFIVSVVKKEDVVSELPKEFVDSVSAKRVWTEVFIRETGIPFILEYWNNNRLVTKNPKAVDIRNSQDFPDPTGQTANQFLSFECHALEGSKAGVNLVVLPLDRGLDYIRKNWDRWLKENKSREVHNLKKDIKEFPLSSSLEASERLAYKQAELLGEGYTEHEAREIIKPFEQKIVPQPIIIDSKSKRSKDLRDENPEMFEHEEESQSKIEESQEEYRRRSD